MWLQLSSLLLVSITAIDATCFVETKVTDGYTPFAVYRDNSVSECESRCLDQKQCLAFSTDTNCVLLKVGPVSAGCSRQVTLFVKTEVNCPAPPASSTSTASTPSSTTSDTSGDETDTSPSSTSLPNTPWNGITTSGNVVCSEVSCKCQSPDEMVKIYLKSSTYYTAYGLKKNIDIWSLQGEDRTLEVHIGSQRVFGLECFKSKRQPNPMCMGVPIFMGSYTEEGRCDNGRFKRANDRSGNTCYDVGVLTCTPTGYYCEGKRFDLSGIDCT